MNLSRKPQGVRSFSAPGKTFLLGEYLILEGGPALLAATGPRFVLTVDERESDFSPFHPESPAGRLLRTSEKKLKGKIDFHDPHQGAGGLGASSAQFALTYAAIHDLSSIEYKSEHWLRLQSEFSQVSRAQDPSARPPSGGDLISQLSGGLIEYAARANSVEKLAWPFSNLTFTLIRTGHKVKTHEHLGSRFEIPAREMQALVLQAKGALQTGNEGEFVGAVNSFAEVLEKSGLTVESTLALMAKMRAETGLFQAVKGCGALGADIVFAVYSKRDHARVRAWLTTNGLEACGSLETLSPGVCRDCDIAETFGSHLKETATLGLAGNGLLQHCPH